MEDKCFLQWFYDRMVVDHGEDVRVDYMRKFKAIIDSTPPDQLTLNVITSEPQVSQEYLNQCLRVFTIGRS